MRHKISLATVGLAFLAIVASAEAQLIPCAARVGLFSETAKCASNCCLTLIPVPNFLHIGAGVCVDAGACAAVPPLRACEMDPGLLSGFDCDAECGTGGCCLTLLGTPNGLNIGAGLCMPDDACGTCP